MDAKQKYMKIMLIYISGTMGGGDLEELEKKFKKVEDLIVELGHLPINPVQKLLGYPQMIDQKELLLKRIKLLIECDCIFLQEDWKDSPEGRIERSIAFEMGLKIKRLPLTEGKYSEFIET